MPEEIESINVDAVTFMYDDDGATVFIESADGSESVELNSQTANELAEFFAAIRDRLISEGL